MTQLPEVLRNRGRLAPEAPHSFICVTCGRTLEIDCDRCGEVGDHLPPAVVRHVHEIARDAGLGLHEAVAAIVRAGVVALGRGAAEDHVGAVGLWRRLHEENHDAGPVDEEGDDGPGGGDLIPFPGA